MGPGRGSPLLGLFLALLVACSRQPPPCPENGAPATRKSAPFGQIWVGTRINVDGIEQVNPQVANAFFNVPEAYVIETGDTWPWSSSSKRTAYWASADEFERDVREQGGSLPGVHAALYDPESWRATPIEEQRDPGSAMRGFSELARGLGYGVVITPGLKLADVEGAACTKSRDETEYDAYLRCDIAGTAARFADVVEIQAQTREADPEAYREFVAAAAKQAREANPGVKVVSGFRVRNVEDIEKVQRTWLAVRDVVDGHYLAMSPGDAAVLLRWISSCAS